MTCLEKATRTHSAQKHKSNLRKKLRQLFLSAIFVSATVTASSAWAGPFRSRCNTCEPCNSCGPYASQSIDKNGDGIPDGSPTTSMDLNGDGIPDAAAAMAGDYYSNPTDLASSTQTLSPNMIGDLLSNGGYVIIESLPPGCPTYAPISIAGGDRRFKISENMSPLPRDRVFYTFNGFQQAARTIENREIDVYRHTLGGEKTFWGGSASFEVRMPILQGLGAVQTGDGDIFNDDAVEFGNMTLIPKFILREGDGYVLSTGLGINLPTARDSVTTMGGTPFLEVANESVHLSPFLGLLVQPNDTTYVISYVQADFDANGNTITSDGAFLGRYQDQTLLHFDIAVGRYIYQDYNTRLTGIAPQLELHYTTTLQDSDVVPMGTPLVANPFNRLDLLTLTAGVNFEFWNTSWLTVGAAVPLRAGDVDPDSGIHPERPFDVELQVLFNRYF